MDNRIDNVQYGLHSTLSATGKDVHTPGAALADVYYTASHYRSKRGGGGRELTVTDWMTVT